MIVVAGATGNAGGALVTTLVERGEPVRAVSRTPDPARFPPSVEVVAGDLDDPASMTSVLAGADGVFLLSGYADMPGLLAEVRRAGVGRVVLLSSSSVPSGDTSNAVAAYHIRSEQAVRDSGVPATYLRPSMFMTNALQWADQLATGDVVRAPWPDLAAALIDPLDIGAVAAVALVDGGYEGEALRLTGPQALRPAERLRILADRLGRDLTFVGLTTDEAVAELSATMPARYVDAFVKFYVRGDLDESPVLPTVREVLGREPRTFADWVADHADVFTAGPGGAQC
jgi:uncharacterized protein YbjT (DUF2867 family)